MLGVLPEPRDLVFFLPPFLLFFILEEFFRLENFDVILFKARVKILKKQYVFFDCREIVKNFGIGDKSALAPALQDRRDFFLGFPRLLFDRVLPSGRFAFQNTRFICSMLSDFGFVTEFFLLFSSLRHSYDKDRKWCDRFLKSARRGTIPARLPDFSKRSISSPIFKSLSRTHSFSSSRSEIRNSSIGDSVISRKISPLNRSIL